MRDRLRLQPGISQRLAGDGPGLAPDVRDLDLPRLAVPGLQADPGRETTGAGLRGLAGDRDRLLNELWLILIDPLAREILSERLAERAGLLIQRLAHEIDRVLRPLGVVSEVPRSWRGGLDRAAGPVVVACEAAAELARVVAP